MNDTSGNTVALTGETAAARRPCMKTDPCLAHRPACSPAPETPHASPKHHVAAMLCLAFALTLAACGNPRWVTITHQHWTAAMGGEYIGFNEGKIYQSYCYVLQEDVSKAKHSSSNRHNPDYTSKTFVITSNSEHYPGKSGDKFCVTRFRSTTFVQTKENEFIIQATASDSSEIDYAALERGILYDAAALGRLGNFKYGVFDSTEERKQEQESKITSSTSITTDSGTGVVTPLYNSTYGVRFGNASTTTSVNRTQGSITVTRKHSVRYYNSEPDTDGYFDAEIVLKSMGSDTPIITDRGISNAKFCYYGRKQCGYFDSDREDYTVFVYE